ncbi:hypothetical protein C8J57DRAFT_1253851 [Mycena rebaudengoi]|nr:hypothetical protein C8J57DRAFT_1253851 [Mycena rebaudengoi]
MLISLSLVLSVALLPEISTVPAPLSLLVYPGFTECILLPMNYSKEEYNHRLPSAPSVKDPSDSVERAAGIPFKPEFDLCGRNCSISMVPDAEVFRSIVSSPVCRGLSARSNVPSYVYWIYMSP